MDAFRQNDLNQPFRLADHDRRRLAVDLGHPAGEVELAKNQTRRNCERVDRLVRERAVFFKLHPPQEQSAALRKERTLGEHLGVLLGNQ